MMTNVDAAKNRIPVPQVVLALAAICLVPGCSTVSRDEDLRAEFAARKAAQPSDLDRAAAAKSPPPALEPGYIRLASDREPVQQGDKRTVIYTAQFRIVVQEIEAAIDAMERLAEAQGGYVQSISGDQIVIRVPVANYQAAVAKVESLGNVSRRDLQATDVTEEYVDLQARLKNSMAVRARLEALLAKAENVEAALAVEKELNRVGEEIERLQAKLEVLKNRVAYSTITADFERVYRAAPLPQQFKLPFNWLKELDPSRLTRAY
jgi:hypothetical protein